MTERRLTVHTKLMAHTAEMLALPHFACRRRDCRRRNACFWHFKGSGEPCCLPTHSTSLVAVNRSPA